MSECLNTAILVCRLWTMEKDVSGLTCSIHDNDIIRLHMSSHQESAWGAAEARQEKVIVEVVRKSIVPG